MLSHLELLQHLRAAASSDINTRETKSKLENKWNIISTFKKRAALQQFRGRDGIQQRQRVQRELNERTPARLATKTSTIKGREAPSRGRKTKLFFYDEARMGKVERQQQSSKKAVVVPRHSQ
jgi:hypothetical protein